MAVQKEFILKPSTNIEHILIIAPLTTKRNNPKVRTVTGNVRIVKTGFTNIFSNPKTAATITAVVKLSTSTVDIKLEISITKPAVISILKISFISFFKYIYSLNRCFNALNFSVLISKVLKLFYIHRLFILPLIKSLKLQP